MSAFNPLKFILKNPVQSGPGIVDTSVDLNLSVIKITIIKTLQC